MTEKEVDKILKPKRKLLILLIIFLGIATICISLVFYVRNKELERMEEPLKLSELISNNAEEEGQYVQIDIAYLPKVLGISFDDEDYYFYYAEGIDNQEYILKLKKETFDYLESISNEEDKKLNETYHLEGFTYNMDSEVKRIVLMASARLSKDKKITSDNLEEIFGKVYINESKTFKSQREITLYTVLALFGVFFLILALGYLVPSLTKAKNNLRDIELLEDVRHELLNLTDTPYKKQHLYLTKKYVVSGLQAIKYEDIIWIYMVEVSNHGIKAGRNLIACTKDKKENTIASVTFGNNILDDILEEIHNRNSNIKVGYNDENKNFFENY